MSNLSLEYLPNLLVFKNENYDLVHSLPYIEQPLSKQKDHTGKSEHDKVKDVINQEMKAMDKTPESYIDDLPIPQTRFLDSEEMQKEFDRISKIKSDLKKHDQDIHEDISDKIPEIQLEYSSIKRLNLELMQQYEADEWDQQQNDDLIHNLEYQKSQIEKEILGINKKRKFSQTKVQDQIIKDHYKTQELIQKNILLEQEILKLQSKDGEIESSKRQKIA